MAEPRSFWKADPSVWEVVIAPYLEGGDPWPREVACEDLRWLADQHRMKRRSFPSRGALSRRWSWGEKKTRLLLASEDPLCQGPNEGRVGADEGPGRGQVGAGSRIGKPGQSEGKGRVGADEGPGRGQVGAGEGPHARSTEHRAQSTDDRAQGKVSSSPTALPLVLTPPESQQPDEWQELHQVYVATGSKPIRNRDGALGRCLRRILDAHGPQDAELMLQWLAYATDCPKATSLAESGHRTLATIGREAHVEAYWSHVAAWCKRGKVGMRDARAKPKTGPRKILNPSYQESR